jgi:hypothetical protein
VSRKRKYAVRAAAIAAVSVLLVAIALFVHEYQVTGDSPAAGAPIPSAKQSHDVSNSPTSTAPTGGRKTTFVVPGGGATLTLAAQGGPGLVIRGAPTHRLTMSVTSSKPIPRIGYFVPTSLDASTGDITHLGSSWSKTTLVTGRPDYAVLFVQADPSGTPQTCRIVIDGVVKSVKTTHGPYGRQVCYA